MIHKDKNDLKGTNVLKYIEEGERKGFHKRPTCASRGEKWYELPEIGAPILSKRFVDVAYEYFVNPDMLFVGDTFFGINPQDGKFEIIGALLNSTLWSFMTEIYGRTVMGEGVLLIYGPEIVPMTVVDPSKFSKSLSQKLQTVFEKMCPRSIGSIFDELGASSPEEVSLEKIKPDRRELDKIIMGEILGLTEEEQLEVYRAVVDLVKSRIEKAQSFGKKKKTREGIDVDAFVKTVMDNIGGETLGKFYREKILSQESLLEKTLPRASGEVKIEQGLFGWRLSTGQEKMECHSEEEARYLRIFLEAGIDRVKIPEDKDYLKSILPEAEELKARIDEIIDSYLESIMDPKIREKLRHQLWSEIMK
jgi:DNA-binding ferritin-like protein (Dps family)